LDDPIRRLDQHCLSLNGFKHEEAFLSNADALEWERMILDTLAMPQAASLNLAAYAARSPTINFWTQCWRIQS